MSVSAPPVTSPGLGIEANGINVIDESERRGTPLFDSRLPPGRAESVLEHVAEGCGVRQTGRLCRVNPNTVARYSRLAGQHAKYAHDELVELSPPDDRGPVR